MKTDTIYPYKFSFFIKRIGVILIASAIFYFTKDAVIARWLIAVIVGVYLLLTIKKNRVIF